MEPNFLHSKGIIYVDLKPNDLLLNEYVDIKLRMFEVLETSKDRVKDCN
jgi:serine/threonine protein kinase